jgi:hypothetical protein
MPSVRQRGKGFSISDFGACGGILGEAYFPMDGDDDLSKAEISPPLSWRGDPLATHSDWTIVVVTGEFDSRTFHVHKSILSVGPRSSKYFANLFLEQGHHYNQSQTTRIELDEQDAGSFPLLLDFMYNTKPDFDDDDSLSLIVGEDFTTSNAVSLRHLARVFDCEGLMLAVNKFIQKDLSLKTGPVYLTQAYLYQDERLIESAKRLCVDNFTHLDKRDLTKLPLPLFRSVVFSVTERSRSTVEYEEDDDLFSIHLSEVVCQYFERHPQQLTVELLLELTDECLMPRISSEPAIGFTAMARDLDPSKILPESDEWKGLVDLCKRCARSVVLEYGWKDFNVASALEEYVNGPCNSGSGESKMDSLLFATSFGAALERAQLDIKNLDKVSTGGKRQVYDLQKDNEDLLSKKQGLLKEVDKHRRVLADTKEELLMMKQEMKNLKNKQRMSLNALS